MMKMIIERPQKVQSVIKENNEGTDFYIEGIFSTPDMPNANGRVYPREVWQRAIEAYMVHINTPTTRSLMEWEHTDEDFVNPMNSVAKIESLYLEGNYVMGRAKLLDNPKANILKDIIKNGINIGVSSRGIGDFDGNGRVFDYELITFDCVSDPSDSNAYVGKSKNIKNGIKMTESYKRNENGIIERVAEPIAQEAPDYTNELLHYISTLK